MSSHTPIVMQNKSNTPGGKVAHGVNADQLRPTMAIRQDRKALRDISNVGKHHLPGAFKGSNSKQTAATGGGIFLDVGSPCEMASYAPVVQTEKLNKPGGKVVHGLKTDLLKPAKTVRHDRKALGDISNVGKHPHPVASKYSTLKQKSASCERGTTNNALYNSYLAEEDTKRCHEWAKDGIEQTHYTGNDLQNHLKDMEKKRVNKKVDKVISALHEWSSMSYGLGMPMKGFVQEHEDLEKLELEPEVLPPTVCLCSTSGDQNIQDLLLEPELCHFLTLDLVDTFTLREDDGADVPNSGPYTLLREDNERATLFAFR